MIQYRLILLVLLMMPSFMVRSQNGNKNIQLLSEETNQPIVFAYYTYGSQKGISDEKGIIDIWFNPGERLNVSHVSFGKKSFTPEIVHHAFQNGIILVPSGEPMNLQPVTIIALRDHGQPIPLSENDKLSHDAGAVLTSIPTISVIKKAGSYGFDPVLRGFKYDQLNIVVDGVQSAGAACPNRMDPPASQVPINQMEKVEIFKGPFALRYGPAFGGVINFISQQPSFQEKSKNYGHFSSGFESNGGLYRLNGAFGTIKEKMIMSLNGSWSQGGHYTDGAGIEIPANFKRGSIGFKGNYKITAAQQLDVDITRNFARNVDFAGLPMDLISDDTWLLRVGHSIHYRSKIKSWKTSGFLSIVDHLMDNLGKELNPRMVNAWTPANTKTLGGRTEVNLQLNKSWAYIGGDIKIEEASGYRSREFLMGPNTGKTMIDNAWQDARISRSGLFTEFHIHPRSYHITTSARLDLNHARTLDPANEYQDVYGDTEIYQINPSFSMGINRDVVEDINLGLWLGRGQRSGSITERFINFFPVGLDPYELLGNPQLKPEINNQIDLNLTLSKERHKISYSIFSSWLQNFVTAEIMPNLTPRLPASPGVRGFTNAKNARISGFDITWVHNWPFNLQHQLDASYLYGKNLEKNEPLPEIPPLDIRLRISGKFLKDKLSPEIALRKVMRQNRVSTSFGESSSNDFFLMEIKASYQIDKHVKIACGVENLFNTDYYEHLNRRFLNSDRYLHEMGRNGYISVYVHLDQ
jgi:iron complex outermembrane recepter protein